MQINELSFLMSTEANNGQLARGNIREALIATLDALNIKAVDLTASANLRKSVISEFRGGQDLRLSTLQSIIDALPDDAYAYFCQYLSTNLADFYEADSQSISLRLIIANFLQDCKREDILSAVQEIVASVASADVVKDDEGFSLPLQLVLALLDECKDYEIPIIVKAIAKTTAAALKRADAERPQTHE